LNWIRQFTERFFGSSRAEHLERGDFGERMARRHLRGLGLKFLTANFRSSRGEVDLIFRDEDCLVFVEVKTRSSEDWARPAAAVDRRKKTCLSMAATDYLRLLRNPAIKYRFDIVEVLVDGNSVKQIRHLPNAFSSEALRRQRHLVRR
jgi:putative endonuclease